MKNEELENIFWNAANNIDEASQLLRVVAAELERRKVFK